MPPKGDIASGKPGAQARDSVTWVLAIDGSAGANYAAQYVAGIAKRLQVAEVRIVNVQAPAGQENTRRRTSKGLERANSAAEQASDTAQRMLKAAGLKFTVDVVMSEDAASAIAACGRKGKGDEIVMGTRGLSALRNITLGSVAYKVLHLARVPVTLVPSGDGRASRRPAERQPLQLLLACDGSRASQRAVEYACRLASVSKVSVALINVQPRIVSGNVRSYFSREQIESFHRDEALKTLRGAQRRLEQAGVPYEIHISAGPAAEGLVHAAQSLGCDRIVMGTRGLAAASSLIMGSVTYGVVQRADVPVTLVK